jgi:hypothetical protein
MACITAVMVIFYNICKDKNFVMWMINVGIHCVLKQEAEQNDKTDADWLA